MATTTSNCSRSLGVSGRERDVTAMPRLEAADRILESAASPSW
jgi:hypothetical protein